ncbi:MAG TPA: peroxidase-related enzyme [Candidatus Mcinerneyibacteriales bacterium]|jgi:uncharacterized peroxidase-related enzyme|nr:peroxidase-related enzyme [Candidatus Mcinerneyibacteriales bacterium]
MAWIKVIPPEKAEGALKRCYEEIRKSRGKLAHIHTIHSLNPESLKNHMDLYMTIMFSRSGLSRQEREMIAVVVSASNQCPYCIRHHGEALNYYWKDREKLERFIDDYSSVTLSEKQFAMLSYARSLTKEPSSVDKSAVDQMKKAGFSDEEVLNINLIVSYFNFVNRIAMGLGVETSESEASGYQY